MGKGREEGKSWNEGSAEKKEGEKGMEGEEGNKESNRRGKRGREEGKEEKKTEIWSHNLEIRENTGRDLLVGFISALLPISAFVEWCLIVMLMILITRLPLLKKI